MRLRTIAFILVAFSGCSSITSTPISRTDENSFYGDTNGKPKLFGRTRAFKGTPVKLKVQTHVDVFIEETYYMERRDGKWRELCLPDRLYCVRQEPVATEQIVMVDFKRPASGSLDLSVDYNQDQYLKSINSKLVDTTLADSAELLGTIVNTFATPVGAAGAKATQESSSVNPFVPKVRTVAYQRFDINAPDYEQQLEVFVGSHLNICDVSVGVPVSDQAD